MWVIRSLLLPCFTGELCVVRTGVGLQTVVWHTGCVQQLEDPALEVHVLEVHAHHGVDDLTRTPLLEAVLGFTFRV